MHFEILVEDQSGKKALDILIPKIIGDAHTFITHSYKGIGRIPRNMRDTDDASKRILLENRNFSKSPGTLEVMATSLGQRACIQTRPIDGFREPVPMMVSRMSPLPYG